MAQQLRPPNISIDYLRLFDEWFVPEMLAAIARRKGYIDNMACPRCGSSDCVRDYPEVSPDTPLVRANYCPGCGELASRFITLEEWSKQVRRERG